MFCIGTAPANSNDPSDLLGLSFVMLRQAATDDVVDHLSAEITTLASELSACLGGGYLTLSQLAKSDKPQDRKASHAPPSHSKTVRTRQLQPVEGRIMKLLQSLGETRLVAVADIVSVRTRRRSQGR